MKGSTAADDRMARLVEGRRHRLNQLRNARAVHLPAATEDGPQDKRIALLVRRADLGGRGFGIPWLSATKTDPGLRWRRSDRIARERSNMRLYASALPPTVLWEPRPSTDVPMRPPNRMSRGRGSCARRR